MKAILSLCDYTGNWAKYYREAGYYVQQVDLKTGADVRLIPHSKIKFWGILAAPPCGAFSRSGAQYWPKKDQNGETLMGLSLVDACLRAVALYQPHFWALENPVGRLKHWLGEPRLIFNPCDYGDPYTKKTCLWGNFHIPRTDLFTQISTEAVEPVRVSTQGSWLQLLGGSSEKTKTLRSTTPLCFAKAFFEANP